MSCADEFVHPEWGPYSIDNHHVRVSILKAVEDALPLFHGTILDIGCGEMPYRDLLLEAPSRATHYIGLDLAGNTYSRHKPDVRWDGAVIPLRDASVESALATEVLEHCPEPLRTLSEIHRVLKPGGVLLITVPFLWPIHDPPYDEYRYTPFGLDRLLREAGFENRRIRASGGWDASLAQMLGLWVRRRPMREMTRRVLQRVVAPVCSWLYARDRPPIQFNSSPMITGLSALASKPV
jgi:SAM-dependent methyltransferase